jgi:hypothetical protein
MKKIKIMPKVVVYKDLLSDEDLKEMIEIIKASENSIDDYYATPPEDSAYKDHHGIQPMIKDEFSIINKWTPWYTYGSRTVLNNRELIDNGISNNKKEFAMREKIKRLLQKAHEDYVQDGDHIDGWPYSITNLSLSDDIHNALGLGVIEILKHKIVIDNELAIGYHTDFHEHKLDSPGEKQIITYTVYLNDDNEGGEIEFIDERDNRLITYKPKAGDITVFPSGKPYWHSAKAVSSGNNKIFFRTFAIHYHEGSEAWRHGELKYGKEKWESMELERIKIEVDSGEVGRQIVRPGQIPVEGKNLFPLYINQSQDIYIDGREL